MRRTLDRRGFLRSGGVAVVGAWVAAHGWVLDPAAAAPPGPGGPVPGGVFTTVLRRREDFLHLHFEFRNLRVENGSLVRNAANASAYIVVTFPPQSVAEEALFEFDPHVQDEVAPPPEQDDPEPTEDSAVPAPPLGARLAGASRLAFLIPPAVTSIEYTAAGLLAWDDWQPLVVGNARPPGQPDDTARFSPLAAPGALHTAIELPWWLIVSPHAQSRWAHMHGTVTGSSGRTELWHTRLAAQDGAGRTTESLPRTIRAVWARDPSFGDYLAEGGDGPTQPADGEDFKASPPPIGMPFRTSLSPRDRFDIVTSSADFAHETTSLGYDPAAVDVDRLMLTALGGWLDANGTWDDAGVGPGLSNTSLEAWRHRATLGRDHYVRIVRRGRFYPIKHAAALLKITERKFRTLTLRGQTRRVAYLTQRYLLVPREREVVYGGPFDTLLEGRASPFVRLVITTPITPNLDEPIGIQPPTGGQFGDAMAFVPHVGHAPLRFALIGEDHAGRTHAFTSALVFVDAEIASDVDEMARLNAWYAQPENAGDVGTVHLDGARVAAADPGEELGSTDLEIRRFTWGTARPHIGPHASPTEAGTLQLQSAGQPAFLPTMAEAEVRLAAVDAILGADVGPPVVSYRPDYAERGFSAADPGEVFAQLTSPLNLEFGGAAAAGDRAGAVATPSFQIRALSRHAGPIGGEPDTFQAGEFDPAIVFATLNATLLGDLALKDVIGSAGASDPGALRLVTRDTADAVVTEMRWKPLLVKYPTDDPVFIPDGNAVLELAATIVTPKATPQSAAVSVVGDLRNFQVALLPGAPMVRVHFDRLRFTAESGKKTDVDADIRAVEFLGALGFVQDLQEYLSFDAGGFAIDVTPTHVVASLQLPLPNLTIGVFALQNLAFAASATLPFTGEPVRFRFGFCTLDNPFLLTVMIFSGGGFFALGVSPNGVEEFQMSLEFGAAAALDLGVASGSVSITAGIYLAIGVQTDENPLGAAELTGFLKLTGEVEVLGVLSISLFMKASMTYIAAGPDEGKAIVKAVVVVEVEVLMVSESVEIEYEKKFGGGNADPTFGDTLTQPQWTTYAAAFAPIGA